MEIGYPGNGLPLIFMATAKSADLQYYLAIATSGSHGSGMTVNAKEIAALAVRAVRDLEAAGRIRMGNGRTLFANATALDGSPALV